MKHSSILEKTNERKNLSLTIVNCPLSTVKKFFFLVIALLAMNVFTSKEANAQIAWQGGTPSFDISTMNQLADTARLEIRYQQTAGAIVDSIVVTLPGGFFTKDLKPVQPTI